MNLNDLATFVRVAELGSISAAARAESVPKSTVSRRIARLEEALGVELLRRKARSFTLTDDGQMLFARSAGALREMEEIGHTLSRADAAVSGRVVVTAPHDLGGSPPALALFGAFRERYPAVRLEIRLTERRVDLIAEGVDVGIRAHGAVVPGDGTLMARTVAHPSGGFFASPTYLRRNAAPVSLGDLVDHTFIVHPALVTAALPSAGGLMNLPAADIEVNDTEVVRALIEAGVGVGPLPWFVARPAVSRGALVHIMPDVLGQSSRLSLVWPASRHLAPRVRAFVALATDMLGSAVWSAPMGQRDSPQG